MKRARFSEGFTLAEMITVIGIISALSMIVLIGVNEYREKARDRARQVDIDALAVTMRLYIEQYGSEIDCTGGIKIDGSTTVETLGASSCAEAAQILTFIENERGSIPHDPLGPNNADYYYYFDSTHICTNNSGLAMLFAVNRENVETNAVEVCGEHSGNEGGYINTTEFGGTIRNSQPYVRLVTRTR